jgi:hypothetical protein
VFAVVEAGGAPAAGEAMRQAWAGAGVAAEIRICVLDRQGARLVPDSEGGAGEAGAATPPVTSAGERSGWRWSGGRWSGDRYRRGFHTRLPA